MSIFPKRKVGPFLVNPIGYGAMGLSQAYGPRPDDAFSEGLLHRAVDIGYDFIDTAAIYGDGHNETLIGRFMKARRKDFTLASKCGFGPNRIPDGSPEGIARTLDDSLSRLQLDHIDLYYLHRPDPRVPIEESVGALARAVDAGKIGHIGLSEVSAEQLRRGHAVHPIAALQTEYSLWTRNPEIAALDACRDLGITFVAFSPVGRGFLAGAIAAGHEYSANDIRPSMPRFVEPAVSHNLALFDAFAKLAREAGQTPAQLSLAWLLRKDADLVTIPGTISIAHLEENMATPALPDDALMTALDALINEHSVRGGRYGPTMQSTVTTETYPGELEAIAG